MSDDILNELAGWAGDLQTSMVDAVFAVGESADYETYKKAMIDLITCEDKSKVYEKYPDLKRLLAKNSDIHFESNDMYADVDPDNNEVSISKELSEAAREAFVDYIWERTDE